MQALLAFKGRCFGGLSLSIVGLKSWNADVGFIPYTLQGETWSCEFPHDYGLPQWGWDLCQDCVSASHIHFGCIGLAQLVVVFFKKIVVCASCRFSVSMIGVEFKILLHYHLETELLCFLF